MVWGGIHHGGKTELFVTEENVNAAVSLNILQEHCLPHARQVYGNNFQLQDDKARPHRAKLDNFFEMRVWSSSHGQLVRLTRSPIEHAWDQHGGTIKDRDNAPQTLQELAQALREEWDAMHVDVINNLVDSMPRRLLAFICARGGHTRY
ncbi:uncharacterized protein LOC135481028 [Liolophura sinensis]|uniref:uncharacterized protein LOC135481028 n=1 Tax=Liolophura sinensis TaxID=3198878 RepID=UPI0031585E1E